MTKFLTALRAETNLTYTENAAITNKSTLNPIVDFFALAGAMRNNPAGAADLFEKAFKEDPQTAVRTLFYLRDVRGGQGERDVFRAGLKRMMSWPKAGLDVTLRDQALLRFVPEYGRWDDIFVLGVTSNVVMLVKEQLRQDLIAYSMSPRYGAECRSLSLMAKWLPSENASSPKTKKLARELREALRYSSADYRRILSKLRRRITLLEQSMSGNEWNEIDYGRLPSQAHRKHVKAFQRHTPERYQAYLDSVQKGEAKINVSALYPYEIYDAVAAGNGSYADVAWANLPDYTDGKNALVMADVSGSMWGRPMSVSVSLALYFAERNKGAFHGYFMTFSANPELVQVLGSSLSQRMNHIQSAHWGMNTDLSRAFRAILAAAQRANEPPPEVLYVISDMEFDQATARNSYFAPATSQDTAFQTARREFAEAGFQLPHVVFWNVDARNMQVPATVLDGAVSLVSGCSPTVFGMAVQGLSPLDLVYQVVNTERYQRITL